MGIATNTPTSARGIAKTWCPDLANDGDTLAILSDAFLKEGASKSGHSTSGSDTVPNRTQSMEEPVGTKISKDDLPEEVVEYIDALEDHVEEQDEAIAKMSQELSAAKAGAVAGEVAKEDADLSVILEKADPAVAAVIRKQDEALKAAEARIAKQEEADTERTMLAKAERLPMITTDKDDLAGLLKQAYATSTEFGEKLEQLFKAANEQITQANLFTEVGKVGAQGTVSQSVESAAAELRKADPTLTPEQALASVYETNPALYEESLKEG